LANILIADDDVHCRMVLALMLQTRSHTVREAADGRAALAMATDSPPDLVLLDWAMPHMDGVETCALMRQTPSLADVPVALISGSDGHSTSSLPGFSAILTKPFGVAELFGMIEPLLDESAPIATLPQAPLPMHNGRPGRVDGAYSGLH